MSYGQTCHVNAYIDNNYCKCYNIIVDNFFTRYQSQEMGLGGLVTGARELLQQVAPPPNDGRVAEYPDARTIRYYQTIGAVDKPLRYDGRKAVYGYRHLLQVVVIKLLQGVGLSLAQIQRALLGATEAALEAAVSEVLGGVQPATTASERSLREAPSPTTDISISTLRREPPMTGTEPSVRTSRALLTVEVMPGVSVTIDPQKVRDPELMLTQIIQSLLERTGGYE